MGPVPAICNVFSDLKNTFKSSSNQDGNSTPPFTRGSPSSTNYLSRQEEGVIRDGRPGAHRGRVTDGREDVRVVCLMITIAMCGMDTRYEN